MAHGIRLVVKRGGVTGEPVAVIQGYGARVVDAIKDCLTCQAATKIRVGDFLVVKAEWEE